MGSRGDRRSEKRITRDLVAPLFPRSFETYRKLDTWATDLLRLENPTIVDGIISIRRYEVVIKRIEESPEVLLERLEKLWRTTRRDPSIWEAMRTMAVELGCKDPHEFLSAETQGKG